MKVTEIQEMFDGYKATKGKCEALQAQIDTLLGDLSERLKAAKQEMWEAKAHLENVAGDGYVEGLFGDKQRLQLEGGWVQFDRPKKKPVVTDPSAAVAFVAEKGVVDTVVKSVALNGEAAEMLFNIYKKFPGVEFETTTTFRVSVKKEE